MLPSLNNPYRIVVDYPLQYRLVLAFQRIYTSSAKLVLLLGQSKYIFSENRYAASVGMR